MMDDNPPSYESLEPSAPILLYSDNSIPLYRPPLPPIAKDRFDVKPQISRCPKCHVTAKSKTKVSHTMTTHIVACILCIFCCWPCACMTYCMDCTSNIDHYCPNCNSYLGTNYN